MNDRVTDLIHAPELSALVETNESPGRQTRLDGWSPTGKLPITIQTSLWGDIPRLASGQAVLRWRVAVPNKYRGVPAAGMEPLRRTRPGRFSLTFSMIR